MVKTKDTPKLRKNTPVLDIEGIYKYIKIVAASKNAVEKNLKKSPERLRFGGWGWADVRPRIFWLRDEPTAKPRKILDTNFTNSHQ